MNFIKQNAEFDLISFGEVMLRLSPPDKEKIRVKFLKKTAAVQSSMLRPVRQILAYVPQS